MRKKMLVVCFNLRREANPLATYLAYTSDKGI